jgi:hypothetical protein
MQSLIAEALAVDPVHVHVLCPYCGKVHRHGSFGDPMLTDYGSRVPHCSWPDVHPDGEYQLVVTPQTIRKNSPITTKDLKPWKPRQTQIRRALQAKKKAEAYRHILDAVRQIKRDGDNLYMWRVSLISGEKQSLVREWIRDNGIAFIRGIGGRAPGHGHEWQIVDIDRASPEIRALFEVTMKWAETVYCSACNQTKPGQGSEYYSGDVCRCADCRKTGRPLPYPELCGTLEGIIGKTIRQYPGQIRRRS